MAFTFRSVTLDLDHFLLRMKTLFLSTNYNPSNGTISNKIGWQVAPQNIILGANGTFFKRAMSFDLLD